MQTCDKGMYKKAWTEQTNYTLCLKKLLNVALWRSSTEVYGFFLWLVQLLWKQNLNTATLCSLIPPSSCCQAARWIWMTGQVIFLYSAGTGEPMVAFKPKVYKEKNDREKVRVPQECFALKGTVCKCSLSLFMHLISMCGSRGSCVSFHLEEWKPVWSGLRCYRDVDMNIYLAYLFSTKELCISYYQHLSKLRGDIMVARVLQGLWDNISIVCLPVFTTYCKNSYVL